MGRKACYSSCRTGGVGGCTEPFSADPGLSFSALTSLLVLKNCSKLELGVSGEGPFEEALKKNVFS